MWSHTYGGLGDDKAKAVIQTSKGGYAIAGYTDSFGSGGDDFWYPDGYLIAGEKQNHLKLITISCW